MPKSILYFDNEDQGLSRKTSHPHFVTVADDAFFYDGVDDFAPFGSDDGNEAFSSLERWYKQKKNGKDIVKFLESFLAGWDLGVPWDSIGEDLEARTRWLDEDALHVRYFRGECRAIVAMAFGQFKIAGFVDAKLLGLAKAAIVDQLWMNARARVKHPDWEYANEEQARLEQMLAVLNQPVVG